MTGSRNSIPGNSRADPTAAAYALPHPPAGAPNVVLVVLDDTGFAQLGCFGSSISTPHLDRLAAGGLRYNRFHVTALCSPTRACLLTGRNHHAVGVGYLTDIPTAYPGYTSRIPRSAATLPRLLRGAGYNTIAVGKWHLVPGGERSNAGPFDRWPLGLGFERYYGFLQGDTNHWSPNLVRDNHYVDPPRTPAEGYHLTEDLADAAIGYVQDQRNAAPNRPFFLYFALGATHAPHHVAPEWVAPYHGRFDSGWERERAATFARQQEQGVVPPGTVLGGRPSWIDDWDAMGEDERRVAARYQEVFAGFLTHTDAQIGRFVQFLEDIDELDDTLLIVTSDNGTSAEGGRAGTFNEHRFTLALTDSVAENLARLDEIGGVRAYNHYPWGWAWSGNTPLRLWKRYTWLGGVRTPLIVHWPSGIRARGETRSQFVHAVDVLPTVLDVCGVDAPPEVDGVPQQPIDGASIRATFDDADAPEPRDTQYFEMLGSRAIYRRGWKATTDHVSRGVADEEQLLEGSRDFAADTWALFALDDDFAEVHDVAADHPEVLAELQAVWQEEAERNRVFPLVDDLVGRFTNLLTPPNAPGTRSVYRPAGGPVPDDALPRMFGGFRLTASVDATAAPDGILCALGDWTNGFAFYVAGARLVFALNRAGDLRIVRGDAPVPVGRHDLVCQYAASPEPAVTLLHDAQVVASVALDISVPMFWQHGGTALTLGYDRGLPVCDEYEVPFRWSGTVREVVIEVGSQVPPDPGTAVRVALASE
ncbi:MAG TPA: arylsulfatase [Acidimicrobiia bacterium]